MKTKSETAILYIEDNLEDIKLVEESFSTAAYSAHLEISTRARTGLNLLKENNYDIILLDFHLPDDDGLKVLYEARIIKPEIPIIMITGVGDETIALKAISLGASAYIPKRSGYYKELPQFVLSILSGKHQDMNKLVSLKEKKKVLLIDDDERDIELVTCSLKNNSPDYEIHSTKSAEDALDNIYSGAVYDCILADLRLNGLDAIAFIERLRSRNFQIPVVIITGKGSEELAVKALQAGAYDYVMKGGNYLSQLSLIIENSILRFNFNKEKIEKQKAIEQRNVQLGEDIKMIDKQLLRSENKYRMLIENISTITYISTLDGANNLIFISPQVETYLHIAPDVILKDPQFITKHIHPDDIKNYTDALEITIKTHVPFEHVYRVAAKEGELVWIKDSAVIVKDENGKPLFIQGTMSDITKSQKAEEELHSQLKELHEWYEVSINREEKILELKNEINSLLKSSGRQEKY